MGWIVLKANSNLLECHGAVYEMGLARRLRVLAALFIKPFASVLFTLSGLKGRFYLFFSLSFYIKINFVFLYIKVFLKELSTRECPKQSHLKPEMQLSYGTWKETKNLKSNSKWIQISKYNCPPLYLT